MNRATGAGKQAEGTLSQVKAGGRILIVDDSKAVRELIFDILTSAGYECRAVSSGREALALMDSGERFDLMLCDLLNNPHGITLPERTKKRSPRKPVHIATASC